MAKQKYIRHGHTRDGIRTRTYETWKAMIARCTNPRHHAYRRYGGRGITVDERWRHFEHFLADMGIKPPGLTLERIDNTHGYSPANCRWATRKEQARNRRNNRLFTHQGVTRHLAEWAITLNLPLSVLWGRLRRGWSVADTLTMPVKPRARRRK